MEKYILLFLVFFPIVVAIINYFVGKKFSKVRNVVAILTALIEFALMFYVIAKQPISNEFIGLEFKADGFRSIYALIASFMWTCTLAFSNQYMAHYENKDRYYFFYLLTFGATVGIFYSNTFWTTFMFFEMMSLTSFVLVMHEETKEAMSAALLYLVIAIVSGMILLMGLFFLQGDLGTTRFDDIYELCKDGVSPRIYVGGVCLLLGFGAKAGMFPLHMWLPKAHPVAPAPASALLSGILTKAGVFGIIICVAYIFPSVKSFGILLLVLAVITMLLGAILAVFSTNFKRTLACSSMSQIGFILTGLSMMIFLGHENVLAFEGSFLHMVNHSLIKLSLFMIAGVIVMNIHKLELNQIRGFGRNKWLLKICFALGMLGIMGIPLFNGYISKTLIHEAIVEYTHMLSGFEHVLVKIVEYSFLFAGGLTIAYMLKLFICVFFEKNNDPSVQEKYDAKKPYMNWLSTLVIVLSSVILPFLGFIPKYTSNKLLPLASSFFKIEEELHYVNYFSLENLKGALISLTVGLLVYFFVIRTLLMKKNEEGKKVYVEYSINPLDYKMWKDLLNKVCAFFKRIYHFFYDNHIFTKTAKVIFNGVSYALIFFVRVMADSFDALIYVIRRYILRQYKYAFNYTPISYRLGKVVAHITHEDEEALYADKYFKIISIRKDIAETIFSTFSFDFLAACIGVVLILLMMII